MPGSAAELGTRDGTPADVRPAHAGSPRPVPLRLAIPGGTPGDSATVAALVNYARVLPDAKPGLRTMLDIPVAAARTGRADTGLAPTKTFHEAL